MTPLRSHFTNQADEARVARVWATVDGRLQRARTLRPFVRAAGLAALSIAAAALLYARSEHTPRATHVLELPDGSRVEHAADDRIAIEAVTPSRVELRMTRGRAHFQVAPDHARVFLTHAGAYTIRVVGTEFVVDLAPSDLRVEVSRGIVEVRREQSEDVWRVRAGETWSSRLTTPPPTAALAVPSVSEAVPMPEPDAASAQRAARPASAHTPRPRVPSADAATLFARAQEARALGHASETALLLEELLTRFPKDARVGVAAFQLGRLRLDAGDAKGALAAFDRASNAGSSFQEQVAARRVQALEQLADSAACRSAREAFLRDYPHGALAEVVRRRCP